MQTQKEIWQTYSESIKTEDIVRSFHHPNSFQLELAALLNALHGDAQGPRIAEIGCETGITLMLVNPASQKIFLDYDERMLEKVADACQQVNVNGVFVCEDMFQIRKILPGSLDIVFNAGVIEHYARSERTKALSEYAKLVKPGGLLAIAYPNHFSNFYRLAYTFRRFLGAKYWPWPAEHRIHDLQQEMEAAGIQYMETRILDKNTVPTLYNAFPGSSRVVAAIYRGFKCQGYLRVCVGRRPA